MAFFSGLVNGFRRALDPTRLSTSQALLAGDYGAAAEMAQRFRQLQAEHERLRTQERRKSSRKRKPDGQPLPPVEYSKLPDTFDGLEAQGRDEVVSTPMPEFGPVAFQEGFDRQQEHEIARRRARETGRDWQDVLREMRGLPSLISQARQPGNLGAPVRAAGGAARGHDAAPTETGPFDERTFREKLRRGGGLNGVGYIPTAADRNLLARIIYAESHEIPEDFEAIGWSTINRVGREGYQRTLPQVLRHPNQFEIVAEGNAQRRDHRLWTETERPEELRGVKRDLWIRAGKVADGILIGQIPDPTGGATRFFADTDFDPRRPATAPGGFRGAIARGEVLPSRYRSASRTRNRQYFWLEDDKPRPISR